MKKSRLQSVDALLAGPRRVAASRKLPRDREANVTLAPAYISVRLPIALFATDHHALLDSILVNNYYTIQRETRKRAKWWTISTS